MRPVDEPKKAYPETHAAAASMIGLERALSRLIPDWLSDAETPSKPSAQTESSVPVELQPEAVAAAVQGAQKHWRRRELAIERLCDALCRDELRAFLQLEYGGFYQLPAFRWQRHAFAREIVISGVWRDSAGGLIHFDGCHVFLVESAFDAWRHRPRAEEKPVVEPPAPTSAAEPVAGAVGEQPSKRSRRRRQQNRPQTRRATKVLRRLYPESRYGNGWPTREEVADVDLVARAEAEYEKVEGQETPKSKLGPPSGATYLRTVGRLD
jgi:hypothetical protein